MPPVLAYARVPEVDLLAAYDEHCGRLGLISVNLGSAARTFLRRWPDPQRWGGEPLETRLTVSHPTRSFVTFLMLAGDLPPGYDYLIRQTGRVLAASATRAVRRRPGTVPGRRARTRLHRTHPQRGRIAGDRQATDPDRPTVGCVDRQRLRRLAGRKRSATWRRESQSSLQQCHPHRPAGHVSPRRVHRTAGQRDQPATAELCAADAVCHSGVTGVVCGLPRSVDRHA